MIEKGPALQLLNELWADARNPDFIWQILALALCFMVAAGVARWWQKRHEEGALALHDAGSRLAFPLSALLLVALARLLLKPLVHVNLLKLALPLLISLAVVRTTVFVLRQAFPRAAWLAAWERLISILVWGWLALYITDLAPYVIESLEQVEFVIGKTVLNLWMILHGILIVFLTVIFALWIAGVLEARLMRVDVLDTSLRIVLIRVAKAVLTVAAFLISLSLVGIDMTALSVFTGAMGVGLAFGLQKIASNYVAGFIILLDRSIRLGNLVQVGADTGVVTEITTRYTVLRHPTGTEFLVPNELLVSGMVQNQSFSDPRLRLSTTVGVSYKTDLDLAVRLMNEAAATQARVLADPAPTVLLAQFADSSIVLELVFWIADPEKGKGNILSDVNFAIWRAFQSHGVEIPFPQREVRLLNSA